MAEKFYITTPIYYPNDVPHIGHAYTTIAADVIARWNKLQGKEVFFLTGTDDHGKKILEAATKANKTPKQFTDDLIPEFKSAWKKLNVNYDRFIRTTDPDHEAVVQQILQKCFDNGDIYKGEYEGFYCTGCEAYFTEKDLEDGCCPIHKKPIELLKEETYMFRLSKYQNKLLELYEKTNFLAPRHRKQEIINRVKEGLRDLSISRNSFNWGIPLPFDKTHVTYVWFDALFNYYSATREKGKEDFWPANVHIVGKDIFWFHTVYWPAFLMSAGLELPKQVFAHGWWTLNSEKISKSRGKVISIEELIGIAGLDSARYFLFREASFGEDGDFSKEALIERHNNELANKLGNLVSRTSALAEKYGFDKKTRDQHLDKRWKEALESDNVEYEEIVAGIKIDENGNVLYEDTIRSLNMKQEGGYDGLILSYPQIMNEVTQVFVGRYMESFRIDKALNIIFAYIDTCNEFLQEREPWESSIDENYRRWIIGEAVQAIRQIAKLLSPFIPDTAEKIQKVFAKDQIKKAPILFQKIVQMEDKTTIEDKLKVEHVKPKLNNTEIPNKTMENVTTIQFEDFAKLDLRVAEIENIEDIPGADKLYKLTLGVGELGERTICAGIKQFYNHDDLKGKKIIIIANLEPRKLKGITSQGMLLAASTKDKKTVSLISPDQDISPGSKVG